MIVCVCFCVISSSGLEQSLIGVCEGWVGKGIHTNAISMLTFHFFCAPQVKKLKPRFRLTWPMGKKVTLLQFQVLNMEVFFVIFQINFSTHLPFISAVEWWFLVSSLALHICTWPCSKVDLCSRGRCSGVWGGGGFLDAADALAENDQRRFTAGVSGPGSHFARFGGALPLQKG